MGGRRARARPPRRGASADGAYMYRKRPRVRPSEAREQLSTDLLRARIGPQRGGLLPSLSPVQASSAELHAKASLWLGRICSSMRFEAPERFYSLLCSVDTGEYLCVDDSGVMAVSDRVWDSGCWELTEDGSGESSSRVLTNTGSGQEFRLEVDRPSGLLRPSAGVVGSGGAALSLFELQHGPAELPLASLAHMHQHGYVVLPQIVDQASVDEMKRVFTAMQLDPEHSEAVQRDRVSLTNIINATPVAAKCAVHPVVCGLLEAYIECPFHLGHSPICAVAKPGGTNEHGGWCVPAQHVRGLLSIHHTMRFGDSSLSRF